MGLNKSLNYILPLVYYTLEEELSFESTYFRKKVLPYLINTYIKYDNKDCFAILLSIECTEFIADCKKSIIFDAAIKDEDVILVVFKIPNDHCESFEFFKDGKYSLICKKDKQLILSFTNDYANSAYDLISNVLFKDKTLRDRIEKSLDMSLTDDTELLSKIIVDHETYSKEVAEESNCKI